MARARGVDVSAHQSVTPSLVGLSFLFARASIGLLADANYTGHIANARTAGLVTGAYHFAYDGVSIADQVAVFLASAGAVDLYAVDVEGSHAPSRAQTADFIARVQSTGRRCGLYHSDSGYFDAGQDWNWVAAWSGSPSHAWDFHQYRGAPLDLDRFRGTDAELRAFVGGSHPMTLTLAPLVYLRAARPIPGRPLLRAPGGATIRATRPGDEFPYVGDDTSAGGDYHVVRIPGNTAAYLAHGDVALFVDTPAPDCTAVQRELDIANARITKGITVLGGVAP